MSDVWQDSGNFLQFHFLLLSLRVFVPFVILLCPCCLNFCTSDILFNFTIFLSLCSILLHLSRSMFSYIRSFLIQIPSLFLFFTDYFLSPHFFLTFTYFGLLLFKRNLKPSLYILLFSIFERRKWPLSIGSPFSPL